MRKVWLAGWYKRCSISLQWHNYCSPALPYHRNQILITAVVVMSQLKQAMVGLISVFHEHAGQDQLLNKAELKGLLQKEFGDDLGSAKDPNSVDKLFNMLDQDGSGSADFTEFVTMVASITALTNEMLFNEKK
ncbi:protein S100-A1-like isoform X1 [Alosa sapidissima]|uniref:protein S100-A1-like isoform X1 n=1 Tax=Alosa sapidissima TaxID=34773 RepID=UPI001C0887EA|nr:protein S100-A1-like isoform X1 [Alosa sapidissima]